MTQRIGIVTGGGDCPGLNAVIRAVAKAAAQRGWETIGFLGGYEGILEPQRHMQLDYHQLGPLLTRGGTILGTANRGRFSAKVGHGQSRRLPQDLIDGVKAGLEKWGIRGLVSIGGDGSLSIGQQLFEGGVPLVGVPKTIDNDLEATLMTFGFDSAVACATDALDRLHTTAESHNRVMVLEVMGRYAGWIALYAGVAGGADVILIPEIPFRYDSICAKIQEREDAGKHFTLVVVAERRREKGGEYVTAADQVANREARLGGVGAVVAAENRKAERQGGPRLRPGAFATGRLPHDLRPRALLPLRRRRGGSDRPGQVRRDGGLPGQPGGRRKDHRGHRPREDGPAPRRFCPHRPHPGNQPRRLGNGTNYFSRKGAKPQRRERELVGEETLTNDPTVSCLVLLLSLSRAFRCSAPLREIFYASFSPCPPCLRGEFPFSPAPSQ